MPVNVIYDGQYQRALREYRDHLKDIRESRNSSSREVYFQKQETKHLKAAVNKERRKISEKYFQGNTHAFQMSALRQESQDMQDLLENVTSYEPVKIRGKKAPLVDFAFKQAFGLSQCSTKAVYQKNIKTNRHVLKHTLRCGRRSCSVCSHFASLKEGAQMLDELQEKLAGLSRSEKKNGRLVHIVLTHENVPLDQVFEIGKAWRHTQMMKKKVYKKKKNDYDIWNLLKWGVWRWEVTRNEDTGLYHPHIHIIAYVQVWLAPERGGYWERIVDTWEHACANLGLKADWEGQNVSSIAWFKESPSGDPRELGYDFTRAELAEVLGGAVAEMTKYAVKSTDFTKIMRANEEDAPLIANEVAKLFALMSGRRLKNGFGGFSLREVEEGETQEVEETEEQEDPADLLEVIYKWDKKQRRYVMQVERPWNEERFRDYVKDMQNFKERSSLVMYYGLERETP